MPRDVIVEIGFCTMEYWNERWMVFAADLGGTHLRVALVDEKGRMHAQRKQSTPKETDLINLLNPEIIVIGGGVVNGWSLFERYMRQEVAAHAFP
jgi:predicted NBD/HSP70 family sugar kinase